MLAMDMVQDLLTFRVRKIMNLTVERLNAQKLADGCKDNIHHFATSCFVALKQFQYRFLMN